MKCYKGINDMGMKGAYKKKPAKKKKKKTVKKSVY